MGQWRVQFVGLVSVAMSLCVVPAIGQRSAEADRPGIRLPVPFTPDESRFLDIERYADLRRSVSSSDGFVFSHEEQRELGILETREWEETMGSPRVSVMLEGEFQVWHGYNEENQADSIGLQYDVVCELEAFSGAAEPTSEIDVDLYWTETIKFEVLDPYRLGLSMAAYDIEGYVTSVRLIGPGVEYQFEPSAEDEHDAVVFDTSPGHYRLTFGLGIQQRAEVEGEGSAYSRVRPDVRVEVTLSEVDACNGSDIARPLGVLDAADISLFLERFRPGWPETDLAPPEGVWDMRDVVRFLELFGEGCSDPE